MSTLIEFNIKSRIIGTYSSLNITPSVRVETDKTIQYDEMPGGTVWIGYLVFIRFLRHSSLPRQNRIRVNSDPAQRIPIAFFFRVFVLYHVEYLKQVLSSTFSNAVDVGIYFYRWGKGFEWVYGKWAGTPRSNSSFQTYKNPVVINKKKNNNTADFRNE